MPRFTLSLTSEGTFTIQAMGGEGIKNIKSFFDIDLDNRAFNKQLLPRFIFDTDKKQASMRLSTKEDYRMLHLVLDGYAFRQEGVVDRKNLNAVSSAATQRSQAFYLYDAKFDPEKDVFTIYSNDEDHSAITLFEKHFHFNANACVPGSTADEASIAIKTEGDREAIAGFLMSLSREMYNVDSLAMQVKSAKPSLSIHLAEDGTLTLQDKGSRSVMRYFTGAPFYGMLNKKETDLVFDRENNKVTVKLDAPEERAALEQLMHPASSTKTPLTMTKNTQNKKIYPYVGTFKDNLFTLTANSQDKKVEPAFMKLDVYGLTPNTNTATTDSVALIDTEAKAERLVTFLTEQGGLIQDADKLLKSAQKFMKNVPKNSNNNNSY